MTIEALIKWAAGLLFGGVAIVDILLVVACGKLERDRQQKRNK